MMDTARVMLLVEKLAEAWNLADEFGIDLHESMEAAGRKINAVTDALGQEDIQMIMTAIARPTTGRVQ